MTKIQNTNNVIAGTIPPSLMVEWFNTKAKQADCFFTGAGRAVP